MESIILQKLYALPGILIGLSFHEYAHAKAASLLGDPTAEKMGRVSLNPFVHFSPIGFLCLLLMGFGWGKPVMVNPMNFNNRRRDEFIVSAAGITMNLFLAILFTGVFRLYYGTLANSLSTDMASIIGQMISGIIVINLCLMIFNLIPVPPLDGFNMITEIFNVKYTDFFNRLYQFGPIILLALIMFNITDMILSPAVSFLYNMLIGIFF